jgi:hypothetical protein
VTNLHGNESWQNVANGIMPVLFNDPVNVVQEAKLTTGDEVTYYGSTNGFVYKLDSGTSFDGQNIGAYLFFGPNQCGSPRMLKRFRRAMIDASSSSFFQFSFGYKLDFGSSRTLQPNYATYQNSVLTPQWDSFTWDNFTWDGVTATPSECDMNGTATNYSVAIKSSSNLFSAFTINTSIVHYTPRRGIR